MTERPLLPVPDHPLGSKDNRLQADSQPPMQFPFEHQAICL